MPPKRVPPPKKAKEVPEVEMQSHDKRSLVVEKQQSQDAEKSLVVETQQSQDGEETLSSDEEMDDGTALEPDDSMFCPNSVTDRIQEAVPPLKTWGALNASKKTAARGAENVSDQDLRATDNAQLEDEQVRDTPPKMGKRRRPATPDAVDDVQEATDTASDETSKLESANNIALEPIMHRQVIDGRSVSRAERSPPVSQNVVSDSTQEDRKGKRRRLPSPRPKQGATDDDVEQNRNVHDCGGDEEEARNICVAIEASLKEARVANLDQAGESSTTGSDYHVQTPPATLTDVSAPGGSSDANLDQARQSSTAGSDCQVHTPPATPSRSHDVSPPESSSVSPSPSRRTFAHARQQISGVRSRPISSPRSAHDPNEYRVQNLPKRCEVTNPHLQDALLREQYKNLPNLTLGVFIPWSQIRGSGQFSFSHWGDVCPNMDFDNALAFVGFSANGRYLNPARASPLLTRAVRTSANGFRMNLYVGDDIAILLSPLYVRQSHLLSAPPRGLRQHLIGGIGHTQEWERQVSFICMAFGRPELHAQLSADVMSYTSRTDTSQAYASSSSQFSSTQSPSIRMPMGNATRRTDSMSLGFNEPVPVYDARNTLVDLNNISSLFDLPRFMDEVPSGSFAVVGYSTNAYLSNRDAAWHVSCNLRFVVVVGTPSPPELDLEAEVAEEDKGDE